MNSKVAKRNFLPHWIINLSITYWLIIVNVLLFIISLFFGFLKDADCSNTICNFLALQPENLFFNNYWWTLLTSMFLHSGIFHLFVNMLSLYFIGTFLEMIIGKKRFFWLYLISGLFAGLFFAVFAFFFGSSWWGVRIFGNLDTFAIGASGAIFGLAGVLAVLTPKKKVYLIAGPIIAIVLEAVIELFVKQTAILNVLSFLVSVYIIISLFSLFSFNRGFRKVSIPIEMSFWVLPLAAIIPLIVIGFFIALPIGNMAHLGGFIAGAIYGLFLRIKYKKKTKLIENYFSR